MSREHIKGVTVQTYGLTKRYRGRTAVEDLSIEVRPGLVTGFLGPNGAGKSTTMRMILGLDKPTSGAVTIGGLPIARLTHPMRVIGSLLDARAVHPQRSAFDHLLALAQASGLGRARVAEVLDHVGLTDVAHRPAGDFSLGMGQRLGIAAALLGDPAVLIFDEPLNGLDPEGIRWARSLMRGLASEGRTVLFSSHLMQEMEMTADHLLVIGRGRLVADAPLGAFIESQTRQRVFVRASEQERLTRALLDGGFSVANSDGGLMVMDASGAEVGGRAARAGVALEELTTVRDSLEDVFLRLTHAVSDYEGHHS